jgi:hypothetical protein
MLQAVGCRLTGLWVVGTSDGVDGVEKRAEWWNADRVRSVVGGETLLADRLMGLRWRER